MWTSLKCFCVCGWTMRPHVWQITLNHQPTPIFTRHIAKISISSFSMVFTCCWQCSLNFTQDSISCAFQWALASFPGTRHKYTQTCITAQTTRLEIFSPDAAVQTHSNVYVFIVTCATQTIPLQALEFISFWVMGHLLCEDDTVTPRGSFMGFSSLINK